MRESNLRHSLCVKDAPPFKADGALHVPSAAGAKAPARRRRARDSVDLLMRVVIFLVATALFIPVALFMYLPLLVRATCLYTAKTVLAHTTGQENTTRRLAREMDQAVWFFPGGLISIYEGVLLARRDEEEHTDSGFQFQFWPTVIQLGFAALVWFVTLSYFFDVGAALKPWLVKVKEQVVERVESFGGAEAESQGMETPTRAPQRSSRAAGR